MTLNGEMAIILRYLALRKSGWQRDNYGQFTITMSVNVCRGTARRPWYKFL